MEEKIMVQNTVEYKALRNHLIDAQHLAEKMSRNLDQARSYLAEAENYKQRLLHMLYTAG